MTSATYHQEEHRGPCGPTVFRFLTLEEVPRVITAVNRVPPCHTCVCVTVCRGFRCAPANSCAGVLTPKTSECDLTWTRVFTDVQVKARLLGWACFRVTGVLMKRRSWGRRQTCPGVCPVPVKAEVSRPRAKARDASKPSPWERGLAQILPLPAEATTLLTP